MNAYSLRLRLTKDYSPESSIHWPKDLFEKLPSKPVLNSTSALHKDNNYYHSSEGKTTNDWRFGNIDIDWIDMELGESDMNKGSQNQIQQKNKFVMRNGEDQSSLGIKMIEGSTKLPDGVIHIYRHRHNYNHQNTVATFIGGDVEDQHEHGTATTVIEGKNLDVDTVKVEHSNDGTTLAVLAVPSYMTPIDFMTFIAPASESIAHLRMIRDSSPNRSIVLLKFRTRDDAVLFSQEYNGRSFNVLEPSEICHVVNVVSIEIESNDATSLAISRLATAQSHLHELPSCPVCLERMDTSVTGLVTVPCSHTFHCMCLSKWGDSRCPVCRYSQTRLPTNTTTATRNGNTTTNRDAPSSPSLSVCFDCSSPSNLWICLICGNVGCGRYGRAHAHAHYELTMHLYSLELETQRVWDYAGDGYVHRLIQNKADGKLVELPSAAAATGGAGVGAGMSDTGGDGSRLGPTSVDSMHAEKMEAMGIEYSYLLTSQLDSQRDYYEQQKTHLDKMLKSAQEQISQLENQLSRQQDSERDELRRMRADEEERRAVWQREKSRLEKRSEKLAEVARTLERELREERAVSQGLLRNLEKVKQKADGAEEERRKMEGRVTELEEQVRDLMIYLDVKDKIVSAGDGSGNGGGGGVLQEAAGGTVEIHEPPESKGKKKKTGRKT